jgi:hypothetical protein
MRTDIVNGGERSQGGVQCRLKPRPTPLRRTSSTRNPRGYVPLTKVVFYIEDHSIKPCSSRRYNIALYSKTNILRHLEKTMRLTIKNMA